MDSLKNLFENLTLGADEISALESENGSIPSLTRSKFMRYFSDGVRVEYENEYFLKRRRLAARFMLCKADFDKYISELCDIILSICGEFTWALPAHISVPENAGTEIDLFAAETAQTLAEIKYLMGDTLPSAISDRISREIEKRVITPFETGTFSWERSGSNWAAVCGGCVGMTLMYEKPEAFEKNRERLKHVMTSYLNGFYADGACREGLSYWTYGFGYFMYFVRAYEEYSGDKNTVAGIKKIRNIARFQQNMYLGGGSAVSFSDSSREFTYQPALAALINEHFGFSVPDGKFASRFDECSRFAHFVRSYLWRDTKICGGENADFCYYENSQWYINKKSAYSFAAKGGDNGESHNHNDIGSFIISVRGEQALVDFGAGEYTRDYFSDKRYVNLVCSSLGHSVPIIDGGGQETGEEFRAERAKGDENTFALDISGAYKRGEIFRKFDLAENFVTLTDTIKFHGSVHTVKERFVTLAPPVMRD
ncbi:MAG: heparinase II/III-family protein, partial [Firmicutes bacterium]|nr:heparinase II/III-family protein [Bacillota bacterium]